MPTLQRISLTALLLLATASLSSAQLAKRTSQNPLSVILYDTCSTLPPELITLIVSYCEPNPIYCFEVFSPSDETLPETILAAGHANGEIDLIDSTENLQQHRIIRVLKQSKGPVTALKWLAAQKILISASTLNGYAIHSIRAGEHSFRLAAILQNSLLPTQQATNDQVVLWDLTSRTPIKIIEPNPQLCASYLQLFSSRHLVRSTTTGLCFRTISLDRKQHALADYTQEIKDQHLDGVSRRRTCEREFDGYTVSGCADGAVFVENATNLHCYTRLPEKHTAPVRAIAEIQPGLFATADDGGIVNIYCAKTKTLLQRLDEHKTGPIYALALLATLNGHLLAVATAYGTIQIHNLDDCIKRWENLPKA